MQEKKGEEYVWFQTLKREGYRDEKSSEKMHDSCTLEYIDQDKQDDRLAKSDVEIVQTVTENQRRTFIIQKVTRCVKANADRSNPSPKNQINSTTKNGEFSINIYEIREN